MSVPTQQVVTIDLIPGNAADATGPDGTVRLTRTSAGLQASVDGGAPAPIAGSGSAGRFSTLAATMVAAVGTLTDFNGNGPAIFPNGNPTALFQAADAKLPGGAVTAANAKGAAISNAVVFVDVTTVSWAVGFYGRLATSADGNLNMLGLIGDTSLYGVATYSIADATKYVIYTFKAGGPEVTEVSDVVCDDQDHFFVLAFDVEAGELTLFIDGTEAASTTTLTAMHDADVYLGLYNTVSGDAIAFLGGVGFTA